MVISNRKTKAYQPLICKQKIVKFRGRDYQIKGFELWF